MAGPKANLRGANVTVDARYGKHFGRLWCFCATGGLVVLGMPMHCLFGDSSPTKGAPKE
jgi:hypothetical protein